MNTKTNLWRVGLVTCGIATLLTAGGWAAYECCWRTFVVEEEYHEPTIDFDGSTSMHTRVVTSTSNDPEFSKEVADQNWQQTKAAIAAGHYSLQEVQETPSGITVYVYRVFLADGTEGGYGTNKPLPEPVGE